jgi:hypothetical protein
MSKGIPIERGETLNLVVEFFQDEADGVTLDLTGSELTISDSTFPSNAAPTLEVIDAVSGRVQFRLTHTQTYNLVTGRNYQCKIRQVTADGSVHKHPDDAMVFYAK